jgi:ABC-type transporter Mla MlaB component
MTALRLHTNDGTNPTVITVIGPLTAATTASLHEQVRRSLDHTTEDTTLLLDLSCCTNIDLDGLFGLDVVHQHASQRGISLQLIHVPALINRLLRQHNFDHLMGAQQEVRAGGAFSSVRISE